MPQHKISKRIGKRKEKTHTTANYPVSSRTRSQTHYIRLVTILPGEIGEPMKLKIRHTTFPVTPPSTYSNSNITLDAIRRTLPVGWSHPLTPKYEALSYCWGIPDRHHTGTEQPRHLMVRQNLSEALTWLRHPSQSRPIWIDAICINQSDKKEVSQQVARMGQIYASALKVVAWLGPGSPTADLAISKLSYLGEQVECREPEWFKPEVPLPYDDETWNAIGLWVVQEIQLGSKDTIVKCGEKELKWSLLRRAIPVIDAKRKGVPDRVRVRESYQLLLMMCRNSYDEDLLRFIGEMSYRECHDDRDRIYGLLNLLPPDLASLIEVDYSKSVSEVFEDFVSARIRQAKRLEFFACCSPNDNSRCSWVPSMWYETHDPAPSTVCFRACGMSAAIAEHGPQGQLNVSAISIGSVGDVANLLDGFDLDFLKAKVYYNGKTSLEVYLSTLLLGLVSERLPDEEGFPSLRFLKRAIAALAYPGMRNYVSNIPDRWKIMFQDWMGDNVFWFHTVEGYVGTCRDFHVQSGDQIFVSLGCNHPIVLRPIENGNFRLLGECQVAGFMDDEAVLGQLPRPWRVVVRNRDDGYEWPHYLNEETEVEVEEDPRLGKLPEDWEPLHRARTPNDPRYFAWYRNKLTREEINSDPRLLPDALRKRGVDVQTITLV
ncbi:heterokaryon incompatibility protein-domain-containing protein [Nemania abortiva]|nr:heterokaryon incompatibility protein-domain-containing protein [Nemania abortiva]